MENVFEWAKAVDQKKRKKPPKQLREELFSRIDASLNENPDSCFNCLQALMKFDKAVLVPFYKDYYPHMSDGLKTTWDQALSRWANGVKPTENATIRIAIIIREKLQYVQSASALMAELQWLSLNDDKRSIKEFEDIRDGSTQANLRKLLSLEVSVLTSGTEQIKKMYGVIFNDSEDPVTRQLYAEFLTRHGWNPENHEEVQETEKVHADNDVPSVANKTSEPNESALSSAEDMQNFPQDGVVLAEALLKWSHDQHELLRKQTALIADMRQKEQKSNAQITLLNAQLSTAEAKLAEVLQQKETIECALQAAQTQVKQLEEEVVQARSTIGHVQQMAGNSAKQELDGFRNCLANDLKKTVGDSEENMSDLSEGERAEVYKALFDELIDTLKHHGIKFEVN